MRKATRQIVGPLKGILRTILLGLLTGGAAWADDGKSPDDIASESSGPDFRRSASATSTIRKTLDLRLTQAEIRSVISKYEARTGEVLTAPIIDEEVEVTAPGELVPMRDVTQDVWGGIAAPFWAIKNPAQAWRMFVPIPPKGKLKEAEPPAPDPR